jgi:transmembrane sensor
MQSKDYQNYSLEDFVWDEYFRNWVTQPTPLSDKYWADWLTANPTRKATLYEAKQLIKAISITEPGIDDAEIDRQVRNILQNTAAVSGKVSAGDEPGGGSVVLQSQRKGFPIFKMAAVFVVLVSVGLALYYYFAGRGDSLQQIASGYGNTKKILLPDSSVVVLNGNSGIKYNKAWNASLPREVWLNGEGYFEVKHLNKTGHISPGERFIVHVKNVNVEVLGTSFDIRDRRNKIVIVLNTGSIKVSAKNKPALIMKPGDVASYFGDAADSVMVSKTEPGTFNAWTQKKLIVSNTTAGEVFQYLEDNYGKKIILSDKSISSRKIEGTIMLDNLNDALFVLSEVLDVHVFNRDSVILISKIRK